MERDGVFLFQIMTMTAEMNVARSLYSFLTWRLEYLDIRRLVFI